MRYHRPDLLPSRSWRRRMYRDHWDSFYAQPHPDLAEPSSFARHCLHRIPPGSVAFELGCGNGRDALYFARHGLTVMACDMSGVAIDLLRERITGTNHFAVPPTFVQARFRDLGEHPPVDVVYSRFSLHAVDEAEASQALAWAGRTLRPGGALLIEARSVNGDLYGQGVEAGRDAFIFDDHYRRFIRLDELTAELIVLGFEVVEAEEGRGLAVLGDDDPVVVRVHARVGAPVQATVPGVEPGVVESGARGA
jgi:SAM-dependent methyltransferase